MKLSYTSWTVEPEMLNCFLLDRVRLADTAGVMQPAAVGQMVGALAELPIEIEFHPHNNLGLVTVSSITALESGADALSASIAGSGCKYGDASLEEIASDRKLRKLGKRIDPGRIRKLRALVGEITGRNTKADKAVNTNNVFCYETGILYAVAV